MIRRRSQWIHSQLSREMDIMVTYRQKVPSKLLFSRIPYEFTTDFANSLRIHYLFRVIDEITINSQYVSRNEYWSIVFVSRIHFDLTVFSRNYYKSIIFSQNYYEFTVSYLWIYYQREWPDCKKWHGFSFMT